MMNFPKDNASFSWTRHIKNKMMFYHLSGAQILRIFRKPKRREEGVAPETFAAMQPKVANGRQPSAISRKPLQEELWIMYKVNRGANSSRSTANSQTGKSDPSGRQPSAVSRKLVTSRVTMISAWRYPGTTKPGERPMIPEEALLDDKVVIGTATGSSS